MDNPSAYYTEGSYVEVKSPQVGDKICYFSDNPEDKETYYKGTLVFYNRNELPEVA